MKIFKEKTKTIISTIIFAVVLTRLVEIEENQLAKILELVMLTYRVLNTISNLTAKPDSYLDDDV